MEKNLVVSPERFELPTLRLGIVCSIQLSYEDKPPKRGKNYFLAAATLSLRPFPGLNLGTNLSAVL